jgi:hypothetical protein
MIAPLQGSEAAICQLQIVSQPGSSILNGFDNRKTPFIKDHFLYAARRLAAKDRNGLADPEDIAIELGIGLYEVTELVPSFVN